MARQESVSIAIGKMLDQSGYLQDLREERSEDAESRVVVSRTSRSWCRPRASTTSREREAVDAG